MLHVLLDPGLDGIRTARLRTMSGADELAADEGTVALIDRLLVADAAGGLPPGSAARLPVADRDRLLAALYRELFGEDIEADAICSGCATPFELRFAMAAVLDGRSARRPDGVEGPDRLGRYRLGECVWRLPSTADLAAASTQHDLLAACIVDGIVQSREDELEQAMAALGPPLDVDIDALCPRCGTTSPVRFEIGAYLLRCIANERRCLLAEAHRLARAYGWSCTEIMTLPRPERQAFVRLINAEAAPARRHLSLVG
ncbi:hypothetical protein Q4F19_17130 [Sphingomonas sp. BIUV-7]|uniref:Uncharacterized protein n=1 Tax=Sphingomonas natans TaxID=3063330 RepID=A0ABT8YDU3_9SPHN|nr:hypothetical protein [Sphingomonas sp. BIUV-7]MDO6416112.1 hypothetical protein [Sphingomonas sp. BIUV-7]